MKLPKKENWITDIQETGKADRMPRWYLIVAAIAGAIWLMSIDN